MNELVGLGCVLIGVVVLILGLDSWSRNRRRRTFAGDVEHVDYCPRCESPLAGDDCLLCYWPQRIAGDAAELASQSLAAHLEALQRAEMLSPELGERLLAVLADEPGSVAAPIAAKIATPPAVAPPAAAPQVDVAPISIEIVEEKPRAKERVVHLDRPAAASVVERADRYALARELAGPLPPAAAPVAPAAPKARLADLLSAFMEEKNVRWGELVGGLLIVGCSIALVISFWHQIAEQPWLKFGLFNGVVAALYALGFYTQIKWKLPTTSRGVLVTATLLVPLNFLAIAAFTKDAGLVNDPRVIGGEILSLAVFATLAYFAGRTVASVSPIALAVGVLGPCVGSLLVRRFVDGEVPADRLYGLFGLPLACFAAAVGWALWKLRGKSPLEEWQINGLLRLLGLTAFAVFPACGLLLFLTGDVAGTMHRVAPLVAVGGGPALAVGLMLWRRLSGSELTGLRTAGTAIAILGALIMLAGVALAWPEPALLVTVAGIVFIVITTIAFAYEMPAAHLLAGACLMLGYLVGVHAMRGELPWRSVDPAQTTKALLTAESGNALVLLAALYGAAAGAWSWFGRRRDALHYAIVAGGAAAVSLGLVTWYGFRVVGDPHGATWVYALYGAAALAVAAVFAPREERLPESARGLPEALVWIGGVLAGLALVQGLVYRFAEPWRLAAPLTTAATVLGLLMTTLAHLHRALLGRRDVAQETDVKAGLVASVAAMALVAVNLFESTIAWSVCAWHVAAVAVVWFLVAVWQRSPAIFAAFQTAVFAAVALAGVEYASQQAWYAASDAPWADPRMLLLQAQLAAVLCLAWLVARIAVDRVPRLAPGVAERLQPLLCPTWPAVDHVAAAAVLGVMLVVASYAALPGVAQELAPSKTVLALQVTDPALVAVDGKRLVPATAAFEPAGIPHAPAGGAGAWLLLGLTMGVMIVGLWERVAAWRVLGIFAALAAAAPLLAARWEGEVATASALRWMAAGYFAVGSVGFWCRDQLAALGRRFGWRVAEGEATAWSSASIATLAALAVLPLAAMGGYVALAALQHSTVDEAAVTLAGRLAILGFFATLVAGIAIASARSLHDVEGSSPAWKSWGGPIGMLVLVLGAAPLIVISIYIVAAALAGNPVVGPEPTSLFTRMSLAVNYSVPASLVALVLVGYAIRERSSGFAFVAGLVTMLSATVAFLFTVGAKLAATGPEMWIDLGQLNALVAASFGLAWLGALWWSARRTATRPAVHTLHAVLMAIAAALNVLVLAAAAVTLFLTPAPVAAWLPAAADWLGGAAVAATFALGLLLAGRRTPVASIALSAIALWAVATFVGVAASRWDTTNWLALHVLLVGRVAAPALLLGGAALWYRHATMELLDRRRRAVSLWTAVLSVPAVLVAWRFLPTSDPQEPWWSAGGMLALGAIAVGLCMWSCRRRFLYIASALLVIAAGSWYPRSAWWPAQASHEFLAWIYFVVGALALPVAGWVALELRWIRPRRDAIARSPLALPAYRPATWVAVLVIGLVATSGVLSDFAGASNSLPTDLPWSWITIALVLVAAVACLWDERVREAVAVVYLFGLVLVSVYLDRLNLAGTQLVWAGTMALAAFTVGSSYLWSRQAALRDLAARSLGLPIRTVEPYAGLAWFAPLTALLVGLVVVLGYWFELVGDEWATRVAAGQAILATSLALGLIARDGRRQTMQQAALVVGTLGLIACGWAWVAPEHAEPALARSVATCIALIGAAIVFGLGFTKLPAKWSDWIEAAARFTPAVVVALVASVVAVLGQETYYYLTVGEVPLGPVGIAAIAGALLVLFAASLAAALLPGRDPLGLSERGRMAYVYAAEAVLALLFLHVRVTLPWLFTGRFQMYWPLVVMAIAYLGVGLGEFFARRQQKILAQPLERTGILLPLLPVLGFWFVGSQTNYSVLLLVVGGLYAALAVTRKSFGFGLLAALAANGGLWHYLSKLEGLGLLEHPQLWLIPPALCVLAAAYLNRDRLNAGQMTAIRYLTSMTIYLSSTADIFLQGVAQAPWLPLVLGGLAIAGVLAGIMLRVRAFLFLGTSFLVLAIVTLIWHAAVDLDQTWIWFASGIVVGVAIIVLFAVFEKKRQEVMGLVDQLKQWQA